MKHRNINSILQNSSTIAKLMQQVTKLEQLNDIIAKILPSNIANNCRVANLRNNKLILTATTPVWKNQINLLKKDLISQLKKNHSEFSHINSIIIKSNYLAEELSGDAKK